MSGHVLGMFQVRCVAARGPVRWYRWGVRINCQGFLKEVFLMDVCHLRMHSLDGQPLPDSQHLWTGLHGLKVWAPVSKVILTEAQDT
jgi:hypothetical protein